MKIEDSFEISNENQNYLSLLNVAEKQSHRTRWQRLVSMPVRMVLPVVFRSSGLQSFMSYKTFWGGSFRGLIPEDVSTLIWRQKYFDAAVCRALLSVLGKGGVFIDVGSHFGFFTLLASKVVGSSGTVLAVEPMPNTYKQLKINISKHAAHKNVCSFNVAGHNCEQQLTFKDFGYLNSSLNTHHHSRAQSNRAANNFKNVEVNAKKIDQVVDASQVNRVDLIKIDAESSELAVIEGALETLERYRPKIVVEVSGMTEEVAAKSRQVLEVLFSAGYKAWRWKEENLEEVNDELPADYDNYFFIPI